MASLSTFTNQTMNLIDIIRLTKRNIVFITLAALLGLLAGYGITKVKPPLNLENSIFYSFSVNSKISSQNTNYENLQSADQITESIQGWTKDPAFQETVNNQTGLNFPIRAKKQEKNNLTISFDSQNSAEADLYQKSIDQELKKRLSSYNLPSSFDIIIGIQSFHRENKLNLDFLFILGGLIIGKFLGILASYLSEKYRNRLVNENEISQIIDHKALFYFSSLYDFKKQHSILTAYLDRKYHRQKIQLINLTRKSKVGLETLSSMTGEVEMKSYEFPRQTSEIKPENPAILLVQLGETSKSHLKELNLFELQNHEVIVFNRI